MKIVLITDTHWGVRSDAIEFLDNNKRFLDTTFFPTLEKENITTIIHLGDLVDRRKYLNIYTSKRLREDFLDPIREMNIDYHQIIGNHDVFYKNTNSVNSFREIFGNEKSFKFYENTTEVEFDGVKMLFVPWICDDNRQHTFQLIGETNAQICMGHLELEGFEMHRGAPLSHGYDRNTFSRFDIVVSGHYHHKSDVGNIHYLGSHGEFTWSDYDDPKGFHIFDTQTRELTFIVNPFTMFHKVWYDDKTIPAKELLNTDFSKYNNSYVKLVVQSKKNATTFDTFTTKLYEVNPIDVSIVDDHINMDKIEDNTLVNETEDTMTSLAKYIKMLETDVDKNALEVLMRSLYNEAMQMEISET